MLAFDSETKGFDWWSKDERAFLVQWADADNTYSEAVDGGVWGAARNALAHADALVAHNLSFDVHMVRETIGLDLLETGAELHDTALLSRIFLPSARKDGAYVGHGLKALAKAWLDPDADSYEKAIDELAARIGLRSVKRKGAYHKVFLADAQTMRAYGEMDARYTYDLYTKLFEPRLKAQPRQAQLYELERQVQRRLIRAEQIGVRVDQTAVQRLKNFYLELAGNAREKLDRQLGEGTYEGEGSRDALAEALIRCGVPLHEKTADGRFATSQQALLKFVRRQPVVSDLFEWRRVNKFLTTYIEPMDGRETVHPNFMQAEAWTGRMSCRNPNMQNVPKRRDLSDEENLKVRSMFVPRPGHGFVVADFDSIEYMLLAYYTGVPSFRDFCADPANDPHARTAAIAFGGDASEYAKGTDGQVWRDIAKNATYAITYGAGAPKVMETINRMVPDENQLSLAAAKDLVRSIKDSIPGYWSLARGFYREGQWQSKPGRIGQALEQRGYVETILGRQQVVPVEKHYVGLNALIQGTAADLMKLAFVATWDAVQPLGATPLLVVHDELVVEAPLAQLEATKERVQHAMEDAVPEEIHPRPRVSASTTKVSYAHA